MYGLAKKVCGKRNPRYCKQLDGLFAHLKGFKGGACGVIDGKYCVDGKSTTSGNPALYYAYCVTIADDNSNQVDDSNIDDNSNPVGDSEIEDDPNLDDNSNLDQAKGSKLYYEENGAQFYGIPVAEGTKITEGVVADTCEAAGMKAVCAGDSNCRWSSNRCQVVDFEARPCGFTMHGLAEKVCGKRNPRNCKQLDGLFAHLKGYNGGACGVLNGKYCVNGKSYTSGNPTLYYAYCTTTTVTSNIADDSSNFDDDSNIDDTSNLDNDSNIDDTSNLDDASDFDDDSNLNDTSNLDNDSNIDDTSNLDDASNLDDDSNLDGTSNL